MQRTLVRGNSSDHDDTIPNHVQEVLVRLAQLWNHVAVYHYQTRNQQCIITKPGNYRSVNLTSVCCKTLEHILPWPISCHTWMNTMILCPQQHGFRKGHSCETQLICTIQDVAADLDKKKQTDMIIIDFTKAFDKVPHNRLLMKLNRYGIRGLTQ